MPDVFMPQHKIGNTLHGFKLQKQHSCALLYTLVSYIISVTLCEISLTICIISSANCLDEIQIWDQKQNLTVICFFFC